MIETELQGSYNYLKVWYTNITENYMFIYNTNTILKPSNI